MPAKLETNNTDKRKAREEEKKSLGSHFASLFQEACEIEDLKALDKEILFLIGEENFKRLEKIREDLFLRGEKKIFAIAFAMSLFLRLEDDEEKYNPIRISTDPGMRDQYGIKNIFKTVIINKKGGYHLQTKGDYTETALLTAARQNHGVIRATIDDVGLFKSRKFLDEIENSADYEWIYEMYLRFYKNDIELARKMLLSFFAHLYAVAEKDRRQRKKVKGERKAKGRKQLFVPDMEKILLQFSLHSNTNGRRFENVISTIEAVHAKPIAITQTSPSSSDGKMAGDVHYEDNGISVNVEAKDKNFSLDELRAFLEKLIYFQEEGDFKGTRALFVYSGKRYNSGADINSVTSKVIGASAINDNSIDLKILSFSEYLVFRLNSFTQEDLYLLKEELIRVSTVAECTLLEKLYDQF